VGEQYDCGSEKMLMADNLMGQVRKLGKIMWKTTDVQTHHHCIFTYSELKLFWDNEAGLAFQW
jgi:hypothetical protein